MKDKNCPDTKNTSEKSYEVKKIEKVNNECSLCETFTKDQDRNIEMKNYKNKLE